MGFITIIFTEIILTWTVNSHYDQGSVKLKPIDYSKYPIIRSDLPRSKYRAFRLDSDYFNDYLLEVDELLERYPPKVDVGQGSPNYLPAQAIIESLQETSFNTSDPNSYKIHQYTRSKGDLRLVNIVAEFYSYLMRRKLNPRKEILITAGSTNSLDSVARSLINPGDEVIVFDPFFTAYRHFIALVGGRMITVPLRVKEGTSGQSSNDWSFDKTELESKINRNTKIIWLNNPNNPIGKAYTLDELMCIGNLAKKYDLIIVCDEAGQMYQYDEPGHIRIGSLPGLFKRTLTLTSGGKLFTNTGWRIGWVVGPEKLLWGMSTVTAVGLASVSTPMQTAYAIALETEFQRWRTPQSYFIQLRSRATSARNRLVSILRSVGADVITPTASYCVVANFTKIVDQIDLSSQTDMRPGFKLWKALLIEHGIFTFPLSIFYSEENMWKTEYSLRFVLLRTLETLDEFETLITKVFRRTSHTSGQYGHNRDELEENYANDHDKIDANIAGD